MTELCVRVRNRGCFSEVENFMADYFALNREATSPSDQAMFWSALWFGLILTAVYVGLIWLTGGAVDASAAAWRAAVVMSLTLALLVGVRRYRRSGVRMHVVMQCVLAVYPALAALSAVDAIALPEQPLLTLGSALLLLFFLLPLVLPHKAQR
jgi:hypothetical protein